jgi:hypothetical protein
MPKSIPVVTVAILLSFALLGGCNKTTDKPAEPTAPTAPSVVAKPDAPEAVVPGGQNNTPGATASAGAGASASVSANGVEARAGDVSVKLPD